MRPFSILLLPLIAAVPSLAAPTLPITTAPVFTTSLSVSGQAGPTSVLLMPFRAITQSTGDAWIGEAIEEGVTNDLAHDSAVRLMRPPTTAPSTDGLDVARQMHAQRVVVGSYQLVDDQLRISGQVIDAADGKPVGQLKVTGAKHDLFELEDSLSAELEHALPSSNQPDTSYTVTPVSSQGADEQAQAGAQALPSDAVGNSIVYDPGTYQDAGPDAGYSDGFPEYGYYGYYGYPYFDSGFFFFGGGGRRHYYGGGGHDRGGYGNHLVGGGPIVPLRTGPVLSHGFVGPVLPGAGLISGSAGGMSGGFGGGGFSGGMHGGVGGGGGHR